jgi:beta-barrel assembly-enhancing protease
MRLNLSSTVRLRRLPIVALTIGTTLAITLGQPIAAQALNLRDLLPRVLPGLIQTVQLANISDSQEMQLGQQTDRTLTTKQFKILNNRALTDRVNQIGQRLAANMKRKNLTYTFQVVDDKSINAAATMGGYVYVNKGLIDAAANDAELASVIAHELGHIEARHSIEQAKNSALAQTGAAALKLDQNQLVNIATQIGFNLPRSRRFELDADERGLRMLTAAGYDGQAAVSFMQKLDQGKSGPTMPRWLSSHPDTQVRVKRLQAYASRLGQPLPIATQPIVVPSNQPVILPTQPVILPTQPVVVGPNRGDVVVPTN